MLDRDMGGLNVTGGAFEVGDLRTPDLRSAVHIMDGDRAVLHLLHHLDKVLKRWVPQAPGEVTRATRISDLTLGE